MSGREKVFDDPLSMFSTPSVQTKTNEIPSASKETDSFKTINTDKIHIKEPKKGASSNKGNVPPPSTVQVDREVSALVGGSIVKKEEVHTPTEDILSGLSSIETKKSAIDHDTFEAQNTVFKQPSVAKASSNNTAVVSQAQRQTYSKFHQQGIDDDKLHDLSVSKMIEREELDYDTYGVSNVRQGGFTVNKAPTTNLTKEFNDLESLGNLLASGTTVINTNNTNNKTTKTSNTSISTEATAPTSIDLNNLNLNDYISNQQIEESGGLFD